MSARAPRGGKVLPSSIVIAHPTPRHLLRAAALSFNWLIAAAVLFRIASETRLVERVATPAGKVDVIVLAALVIVAVGFVAAVVGSVARRRWPDRLVQIAALALFAAGSALLVAGHESAAVVAISGLMGAVVAGRTWSAPTPRT
jgi:hypothetical protein